MGVRKKIIISLIAMISAVSLILLLFMMLSAGWIRKSSDSLLGEIDADMRENIRDELLGVASNISDYTLTLELEIEANMRNAANVVYEADRLSGFRLTLADLERLRDRTGMTDFYISGTDGVFTLSTEPFGIGICIFDISEEARKLITGELDFMTVDLTMRLETDEIFKFVIIPRANRRGIIESALEVSAIEKNLQSFIHTSQGIRSMNLFDMHLTTLTSNHAEGVQPIYKKGDIVPRGTTEIDSFFTSQGAEKITFDEQTAHIYFPVFDGNRTRYVLFVDIDTSEYFAVKNQISQSITEQMRLTSLFNSMSLTIVLAILLIFTFIITFLINRIMTNYEDQYKKIERRTQAVMDNERLIKYHTILLVCVGALFSIVQGFTYNITASIIIMSSACTLGLFMFLTRRTIPLNIRIHIISNGCFFVAFICSVAIGTVADLFGLYLASCIVGALYFRKSVNIGMAIVVNATIIICVWFLKMGLSVEFSAHWFINNMTALNTGIVLLYTVASTGRGFIDSIFFKSQENERIAQQAELAREQAESARNDIQASITYASKIQRDLLPPSSAFADAFSDSAVIWEPRDIVSGDIYWMKRFTKGTVLCVADCTGHGVPGAMLTMLVTSALQVIATHYTCEDTAEIIYQLDQRLTTALNVRKVDASTDAACCVSTSTANMDINDGCDIAVLFIAPDGSVTMSSSGIDVFVCDGKEVTRHKGQKLFVGEGKIASKDDVKTITVPALDNPPVSPLANGGRKFYIASDGLYDQMSPEGKQFGFKRFESLIFEHHSLPLKSIIGIVWEAFKNHQGKELRRDDVEIVGFMV